jgi:hypothetical protein
MSLAATMGVILFGAGMMVGILAPVPTFKFGAPTFRAAVLRFERRTASAPKIARRELLLRLRRQRQAERMVPGGAKIWRKYLLIGTFLMIPE